MIEKESDQIAWMEFELLQKFPEIQHATFLKEHFLKREEIVQLLQLNPSTSLHSAKQVHGDKIASIDPSSPEISCEKDALLTSHPHTLLSINHADCQATLLYDPVQKVIGNVHCGWRGSCLNIYKKVIDTMKERYRSNPKEMIACISPSLGPDAAEFIHYRSELPQLFWSYQEKKEHFNFWKISYDQLISSGLLPQNIEISSLCTYSDPERFHSYRRDRTEKRHQTVIIMR